MPYASEAQRRKFHALLREGKISPEVVAEFDKASEGVDLPERLHPIKAPPAAPGLSRVKTEPDERMEGVLEVLRTMSPSPARSAELMRRIMANTKVPVRESHDDRTTQQLAYYNAGAREVHMGPLVRKMPGILAHELGHADAHQNGNVVDRFVNSNGGRVAGLGVGLLGGLAAGMLPKWWHKVLAGVATAGIGAGTVMHSEMGASRRAHDLMARAGASPEELDQSDKLQRFANGTYVKGLWPYAAAPVVGAGIHALLKHAAHAHVRMEERTEFHRNNVKKVQKLVDLMGLEPGSYHLPLRDASGGVGGYAVFKGVKNRKTPVLSTILAKDMRPPGQDIEHMLKTPPKMTPRFQ